MSESPHLGLGYLAPSQAQKHVTVNEAFRRLDALVQLGVLDRTLTAPPLSAAEGDRHIVAAGATGAWAGHEGEIAARLDGVWVFAAPKPGWLAYVAAEGALLVFLSGAWVSALGTLSSLEALTRLGVNATADLVNRLAVASQAVLFTHDGAGVQLKLNKAAAADTASLIYQTGYSGRAEVGLTGSDAFRLKVSPDGASWISALHVDPVTGAVDLPATPAVQVDKFTASGTWTKPVWAKRIRVLLVAGGSGGGSGGLRGPGVAVAGGGGGAPGVVVELELLASELAATVAITIGAGGAGGAAQTAASADGNPGSFGGLTSFGPYCRARAVTNASGGGSASAGLAGVLRGHLLLPPWIDVASGAGAVSAGAAGGFGGGRISGGAGGGGGLSAANGFSAGGSSGTSGWTIVSAMSAAGGATEGAAGAAGSVFFRSEYLICGGSGGGGASGNAVNGGAGGDGAAPGGGGAGGGASRNGLASGKGGDGARGEAWIVSMN